MGSRAGVSLSDGMLVEESLLGRLAEAEEADDKYDGGAKDQAERRVVAPFFVWRHNLWDLMQRF